MARPDVAHDTAWRREIINFYFANNWDNWACMSLLELAFHDWLALKRRRMRAHSNLEMPLCYLLPSQAGRFKPIP